MGASESALSSSQVEMNGEFTKKKKFYLLFDLKFSCFHFLNTKSDFSCAKRPADEITTVTERSEVADPIVERLKSLKIVSFFF